MDRQIRTTTRGKGRSLTELPADSGVAVSPSEDLPADSPRQPDSAASFGPAFIEPERRQAMIAEAAYYRAESRCFEPGHELEDWCVAESEIDGMLTCGEMPVACGQ